MKIRLYLSYLGYRTERAYTETDAPSVHVAHKILLREIDNKCDQATISVFDDEEMLSAQYTAWLNRDGSIGGKTLTYCKF